MQTLLADKIWDAHEVAEAYGESQLYVDLHLIHEVSSPQAFSQLRARGLRVRRPDLTLATVDHIVPTDDPPVAPRGVAAKQIAALEANCREAGIPLLGLQSALRGIVHVAAPELGLVRPGMLVACGDSHTSTLGAFGTLALSVGTSQIEHLLACQCLLVARPGSMGIAIDGELSESVSAKDLILDIIGRVGVTGAAGKIVEFTGSTIAGLSMEQRMTICNMAGEFGARSALIAPDDATVEYLQRSRIRAEGPAWRGAVSEWAALRSDGGAEYDRSIRLAAAEIAPRVTWGTTPAMSAPVDGRVPRPDAWSDPAQAARALEYMGLEGGESITDLPVDRVFIGSCTNGRIEDLRAAARVVAGRRVAPGVSALVVPGSQRVKEQAETEGLDQVFTSAGLQWRSSGCSMCLGMNEDTLAPGQRCASTSNRNFEGRQGAGGRTHLVSPAMAAAAAVFGHFVDVRTALSGDGSK